jgi:hypothetical protein
MAVAPHARPRRGPRRAAPLQPVRAAQPPPHPQHRAIEQPAELHLHLRGVSAEDVAAIIARQQIR